MDVKKLWPLACILLLAVASSFGEAESKTATPPLSEQLIAICSANKQQYHKLLHDISHEVRQFGLDRPWKDVEIIMQNEGLKRIGERHNEHTSSYRYSISKDGWRAGDESEHRLWVEFTVDERTKEDVGTAKPGFILLAEAGLTVEPNKLYAKVLRSGAYPKGSVIYQGLRLPEVAATGKRYRNVREIEVYYDFIGDMYARSRAQGFFLRLTFGDSKREKYRGKKLYFSSASGLDPLEDWNGNKIAEPFESKNTLGEFRSWGSNEW